MAKFNLRQIVSVMLLLPMLAVAEGLPDDQVVIAGSNFTLNAEQLTNFLTRAYKPYSISLVSVRSNANSVAVAIISYGTDPTYIRTLEFDLNISGERHRVRCNMFISFAGRDEIWVHDCTISNQTLKVRDSFGKLSDFTPVR